LSYAAVKQIERQTDGLENPTHADRHSRRGYEWAKRYGNNRSILYYTGTSN